MKIVVCLKQVPDMESKFKILDGKAIDESQVAFKINDFDNYAVEAALQLKEKSEGEVIIVTVGPDRAAKDIRQAFAMGADWGVHITDPEVVSGDSFVVASALAAAVNEIGDVDLVFTGVMSEDNQGAVTGVMLAHMLNMAHCTNVVKIAAEGKNLTVNRELEGGMNEVIALSAPAILAIQSGINDPRYPTLPGIMKAKKKRLDIRNAADLKLTAVGSAGSKTELISLAIPVSDSKAEILQGDPATAAAALVDKLKNVAKVL